ncbi:MAG: hypothetical protein JW959_12060 [Pirellulales bacterium]|nr:hypothetical protein [Pirellulales bacterium]
MSWCHGDFNYDGWVNAADEAIMDNNWGMYQSMSLPLNPIPKPGAVALLFSALAGLAACSWRKRK